MATSQQALVAQLQDQLDSVDVDNLDKDIRLQACDLAHQLWLRLEQPGDLVDRIIFQPQENAIMEIAYNLGIYKQLIEGSTPLNGETIAKYSQCDPILMSRLLRRLASLYHIHEAGPDRFTANHITEALMSPKGVVGHRASWDWTVPIWNDIPAWLKSLQYQNPSDYKHTSLNRAHHYDGGFFQFLAEKGFLDNFQAFMSCYRTDRAEFLDVFPAESQILQGATKDGILIVDVGGGRGHEIEKFVERFPGARSRNVLQEQPEVLKDVPSADAFESATYDFFTPQPVKGARAYLFRMIFHDWPDKPSLEILKNTAAAMKPGYSKLLINDVVMPSTGATRFVTGSDMNMMGLFAAVERSESHWTQLLQQAGFKIVKIWPGVPESVIEAELADTWPGI